MDKVTSKATSRVYARKRISRKIFGHDKNAQKVYQNEIKALHKIEKQEHLIRVVGSYTDSKYFAMILEPVAEMSLKDSLAKGGAPDQERRRQLQTYFGCLAHTIRYLHGIEMLHKDIKPENVLLKSGRLILTDFGTAFDWSKTGQSMTRSNASDGRTPRYQSPEVASAGEFHRSSDIWSLGVVFLEIVTVLRGKSLKEMNSYMESQGTKKTAIHENLEIALSWFEPLRANQFGSILDNEPLAWIKKMLNRTFSTRPTAVELFDEISDFEDGQYCGGCCLDQPDSDEASESDGGFLSSISEADELDEQTQVPIQQPAQDPYYLASQSNGSNVFRQDHPVAGAFPLPYEIIPEPVETSGLQIRADDSSAFRGQSVSPQGTAPVEVTNPERPSKKHHKEPSKKLAMISSTYKKSDVMVAGKTFSERDTFIRWLAGLPEKFRVPPHIPAHAVKKKSRPSVGSQRIGHFLSTLPEEPRDFRDALDDTSGKQISPSVSPNTRRSWTFPENLSHEPLEMRDKKLSKSNSHEDLASIPLGLDEEEDLNPSADIPLSKLVHSASDSNLAMAGNLTLNEFQKTVKDLKAFAANMPNQQQQQSPPPSYDETMLVVPDQGTWSSREQGKLPALTTIIDAGSVIDDVAGPGIEHLARAAKKQESEQLSSSAVNEPSSKLNLGAWIDKAPKARRKRFGPASEVRAKILDTKSTQAPTTIMSVGAREKLSHGRPLLKWNDKYYGYLPAYIQAGKVATVREFLHSGCNPGTVAKPRWAPIVKAIKGRSTKHTKCLTALVTYGVDTNASQKVSGRTPLHYAIDNEPWPGYSTVIYILLTAGANPNTASRAGDKPLLMLLGGSGRLPQEKRDALLLLLAPNVDIDLNVTFSGTQDNALHLAIRLKDPFVVDAVLERKKAKTYSSYRLLDQANGSGFTPLLLAFSIFNFSDDEAEELQIIKLLLEYGANPNEQDKGKRETPLHRVVRDIKNAIVLELLCRHSANPKVRNEAGKRPLDLIPKSRGETHSDDWFLFADRRMRNTLKADDFRPPELIEYLDEEATERAGPAAKPSTKRRA